MRNTPMTLNLLQCRIITKDQGIKHGWVFQNMYQDNVHFAGCIFHLQPALMIYPYNKASIRLVRNGQTVAMTWDAVEWYTSSDMFRKRLSYIILL